MSTIPESMPTLTAGAHKPGDGKACVMEYVSLLAGESWTDSPSCTHPVLAEVARKVNDRVADENRHLLVPLIGRLFGTAPVGTDVERKRVSVGLAIFSAREVVHLVNPRVRAKALAAIEAAQSWFDDPCEVNRANAAYAANANAAAYAAADAAAAYAAADAAAAYAADAAAAYAAAYANHSMVDSLTRLINEYDRLTGRTEHRVLTTTDLTELATAI